MQMSFPKCPSWYDLRGLGRSPISRMTILIPIFGTLILFSSALNEFISLSATILEIDPETAVQISRRNSFFLYFGLLVFSLSTLAYNALCPPVVKEFPTEYDYYDAELRIITKDRATRLQGDLNSQFQEDLEYKFSLTEDDAKAARALGFFNNNTSESREFWLKAKSQPVADLLQKHYRLENASRVGVRRAIYGAYLASFVLIAVPSVITLWKVLQVF